MYAIEFRTTDNKVMESYFRMTECDAKEFCEKLNKNLLFDNLGHWTVRKMK